MHNRNSILIEWGIASDSILGVTVVLEEKMDSNITSIRNVREFLNCITEQTEGVRSFPGYWRKRCEAPGNIQEFKAGIGRQTILKE